MAAAVMLVALGVKANNKPPLLPPCCRPLWGVPSHTPGDGAKPSETSWGVRAAQWPLVSRQQPGQFEESVKWTADRLS